MSSNTLLHKSSQNRVQSGHSTYIIRMCACNIVIIRVHQNRVYDRESASVGREIRLRSVIR